MAKPLNELSAAEAAKRIAAGEATAEALAGACLERIAERDEAVRAWAFIHAKQALAEARDLDRMPRRTRLHGVPFGLKDIIDTADLPTEYNSPIYRGHRPRADAACVTLLRQAGCLILGKTVTTEFWYIKSRYFMGSSPCRLWRATCAATTMTAGQAVFRQPGGKMGTDPIFRCFA
jgi:Asp-tRNA(Asn)/Glu-tRNA(Gln) amidotransferase A subunit family amidase